MTETKTAIPVLAVAAWSGTGKTTLIEKLVQIFKARGLRVAVVKHDGHDFEMDREGKDSWRFTQAGADPVILSSAQKTAFLAGPRRLDALLAMVDEADLILVEGYKNESLPQLGLSRKATGKGFPAEPERYLALVTDEVVETTRPCFGWEDMDKLADFIAETILRNTGREENPVEQTPGRAASPGDSRPDFTHFNDEGRAKMVNVGDKPETHRTAVAAVRVLVSRETFALIRSGGMKKGDVLTVAQIAGVMGAKRTSELIPMCHPVSVTGIDLSLRLDEARCSVEIEAAVSCDGRTGVEMEALTAASTAALTVYDMCKAVQKDMVITDLRLLRKTGGVHGDFNREELK